MARSNPSNVLDPLDHSPFGEMPWMEEVTGWGPDKISRLARLKLIPGAVKVQPGVRGSRWHFRKEKVLLWLNSLEVH